MNCLNFVKVGKVKVPKGSETFLKVSKKKMRFIGKQCIRKHIFISLEITCDRPV